MTFPPFAKAIVGALVAALAPVATDAATNPQGVTGNTGIASIVAAVVGYLATYFVPNGGVKGDASGLVVTVKTDVQAFLAAFAAGLPALVQSAASAALQPAPAAPAEVVTDAGAGEGTLDAPAADGSTPAA